MCSATLHDIGKIFELSVNTLSGKTEYSVHASLSTHIMDAIREVDSAASELGYGQSNIYDDDGNLTGTKTVEELEEENEALDLLRHCLAAHHGKLEFGSPITASIPEAALLYIADNMSAEMFKYNKAFKDMEPGASSTSWVFGQMVKYYKDNSKIDNTEE